MRVNERFDRLEERVRELEKAVDALKAGNAAPAKAAKAAKAAGTKAGTKTGTKAGAKTGTKTGAKAAGAARTAKE